MDAWAGAEMKVADLQEQLRDAQCGVETELHRIYPGHIIEILHRLNK